MEKSQVARPSPIEAALHDGAIGSATAQRLLERTDIPESTRPPLTRISGLRYSGVLVPALRNDGDFLLGDEVGIVGEDCMRGKGVFVTGLTAELVTAERPKGDCTQHVEALRSLRLWPIMEFIQLGGKRAYARQCLAHHIVELHLALGGGNHGEDLELFKHHFVPRESAVHYE